jgi:general secretion pathway protein G
MASVKRARCFLRLRVEHREFLVVVALLGGLVAAVSLFAVRQVHVNQRARVRADLRALRLAARRYVETRGPLPPSMPFEVLVEARLLERFPVDPWGRDYVYREEDGAPVILSFGRDGVPGGDGVDADLSSLDLEPRSGN